MSGAELPYQLRPNKFIDRSMFLDLLARLIVPRGIENYVYVSMGGPHMVDHSAVYAQIGIQGLFSFDLDARQVQRQGFNKPTDAAVCAHLDSKDLPGKLETLLTEFPGRSNFVVWLDYTDPRKRSTQLQETVETLQALRSGDVFRITMNASAGTLKADDWQKEGYSGPNQFRAALLKKQVGKFYPPDLTKVAEDEVPLALASCISIAASFAERGKEIKVKPVLVTSYADGSRMLTATCAITDPDEKFPTEALANWEFYSPLWNSIKFIAAPLLSLREQHIIDANLTKESEELLASLPFRPFEDKRECLSSIESYKRYHRYYPNFMHVHD